MKVKNWTLVEPASNNGGSMLEPGGYVVRIDKVEDVASKEYLRFTFDVAEGEHAGHYSDDFGQANPYTHQFVRSYTDKADAFFRQFLDCLEVSNRGKFSVADFSATGDEQSMVGLCVGVVFQREQYTNTKGNDKVRLNAGAFYAAQDIRNGEFKELPDLDNRTSVLEPQTTAYDFASTPASADVPF